MKRWTLISMIWIAGHTVAGQSQSTEQWMEYIEELADNAEADQLESLYADLSYIAEHPLNLNLATADQLKRLPFLSDEQVESIVAWRQKYGAFATIYELKNIESLDWTAIEYLLPFVKVENLRPDRRPVTPSNLLHYGQNELVMRYDRTLEQKAGYKDIPDSVLQKYPNRRYLGEPFYHVLRYSYTFDERVQAGLVAEKDAGEPFLNRTHKGYDYYSAHLMIRDFGMVKSFVAGDYKASFGQGLVMSHDFMPGRSSTPAQLKRRSYGFRRHYSTNENDFFRGLASTLRWRDLDASLFLSRRALDATIEQEQITSLKTDGMHRTVGERDKMHTASATTIGGNLHYVKPNFALGLTALTTRFAPPVEPPEEPYNLFYFRGAQNTNLSLDYELKNNRLRFYGETALSQNGALATLNALQWTPTSRLSSIIALRSYARDYQAVHGHAFAQNSAVENEQGVYAGLQLNLISGWKLAGYLDVFRFPWLKYQVDAPSSGIEYMAQIAWSKNRQLSTSLRYRYRQKETNILPDAKAEEEVLPYAQRRLRWQMTAKPTPCWTLRTDADMAIYHQQTRAPSRGFSLAQTADWKPPDLPLQANIYLARFRTDDYLSRINSYEKSLLYVYNRPFLYGNGLRLAATVRYYLTHRLSLFLKAGWTHYLSGDSIGSDLELIQGRNHTDINLMAQWTF
jgi:hypothetical protein